MNIGYLNVTSLHTKLHFVKDLILEKSLDVTGISETWLSKNVPDSYISVKGYQLFSCDTDSTINKHSVCLFVSSSLKYTARDYFCPNIIAVHLRDLNVH